MNNIKHFGMMGLFIFSVIFTLSVYPAYSSERDLPPEFSELYTWQPHRFFRAVRDAVQASPEPLVRSATLVVLNDEDKALLYALNTAARHILGANMKEPFQPVKRNLLRATRAFSDPITGVGTMALWESLGYAMCPVDLKLSERRPLLIMQAADWDLEDLDRMARRLSRPLIRLGVARERSIIPERKPGWRELWAEFMTGLSAVILFPGEHVDLTHSLWAGLGLDTYPRVDGSVWQLESALREERSRLGDWLDFLEDIDNHLDDSSPEAAIPIIARRQIPEDTGLAAVKRAVTSWPMMSLHEFDRNALIRIFLSHLTLVRFSEWRLPASGEDGWTEPSRLKKIFQSRWRNDEAAARIAGVELLAEHARRYRIGEDISCVDELRALVWQSPYSPTFKGFDFMNPFKIWPVAEDLIAAENLRHIHTRLEDSLMPALDHYLQWLHIGRRETERLLRRVRGVNYHDRVELSARRLSALAMRDRMTLIYQTAARMQQIAIIESQRSPDSTDAEHRLANIKRIVDHIASGADAGAVSARNQAAMAAKMLGSDRF